MSVLSSVGVLLLLLVGAWSWSRRAPPERRLPVKHRQLEPRERTPPPPEPRRRPSEGVFEGKLEYPVDTGTLTVDKLGMRGARGSLPDLARLNVEAREALDELRAMRVQAVLREGKLTLRWTGPSERVAMVERQAEGLLRALARSSEDEWQRIGLLLDSRDVADRRWLLEIAVRSDDPRRRRVLCALMRDPHHELARQVLLEHGDLEDWLETALSPDCTRAQRLDVVSWLRDAPPSLRSEALVRLGRHPELHAALPAVLGREQGEDAELTWMAMAETSDDTGMQMLVLERLAEIGTLRCLPTLHALKRRLGPLQRQMRAVLRDTVNRITTRCGAVPGALALAPDRGGLSRIVPEDEAP